MADDGHGHGGGHGHGHSHDHGHDCVAEHKELQESVEERWLYEFIDTANIRALNADPQHGPAGAIKPFDQRRDTETWLESDADEQLIITIPFTGSVRLKSFALGSGAGESGPLVVKAYINREDIDFDNVNDLPVVQSFELPRDNPFDAEHPVRVAKFNRVRSLTLFVETNHGEETTRINYLALKGTFTPMKTEPVVAEYEIKPMPGDIRGKLENFGGSSVM
mmetsp:Transcript_15649/g.38093  ORF Transcript_15649/g.38093 Transcript_15649/m.38093 type:complete len:221 (+) Transcript_15649:79-741(+)|eukprot:CAMPEP_0206230408 /NCGR_PEP_ID=MMETSP0047_2-20121206/10246_1 /ASSEMBLY_ACC=CAM_ASM_000192 /TAXON_ID=195065 /ORGANISM="Chroomonas mesostigmatica_cf, Strain CCMP1168" /LENGTH=220 /DNA_ID=CAMNT_0053653835 /DNA_START=80 /DNA_END=742 /DNA_ORIENTATION=-